MLGKRDRDGSIMNPMKGVFFQYSRLVAPFREKKNGKRKKKVK